MSTAEKVGELFKIAGSALCQLGDLTTALHMSNEQTATSGKWTDCEIDMLMNSVKHFCEELNHVSEIIKNRTVSQIETQMRKKTYQDMGLSPPSLPTHLSSSQPHLLTSVQVDTQLKTKDYQELSLASASFHSPLLSAETDLLSSSQIETQLKKKSYQEMGLSPSSLSSTLTVSEARLGTLQLAADGGLKRDSLNMSGVTLSALNATEADIDIEGFVHHSVHSVVPKKLKLDIDSD